MSTNEIRNLSDPLEETEAYLPSTIPAIRSSRPCFMGGHARQASASVPFELWVMGQMSTSLARRGGRTHPDPKL